MATQQLEDIRTKLLGSNGVRYVAAYDIFDRLVNFYTLTGLGLCIFLLTMMFSFGTNSYVCVSDTGLSIDNYQNFMMEYCWVSGTHAISKNETLPYGHQWDNYIETHKNQPSSINYYPWVMLFVGLMSILLYLPSLFWNFYCYNRTGTDLDFIMSRAVTASNENDQKKKSVAIDDIVGIIENFLWSHREYRQGVKVNVKRKLYNIFPFLVMSKRLGTMLPTVYLIYKFLNLLSCLICLYGMGLFIDARSSFWQSLVTPYEVYKNATSVSPVYRHLWPYTRFPLQAFCHFKILQTALSGEHRFITLCQMPMNIYYEIIYIGIWFWMVGVTMFTMIGIVLWLVRLLVPSRRRHFVAKNLQEMKEKYEMEKLCLSKEQKDDIEGDFNDEVISSNEQLQENYKKFVKEFLRHDGYFLIRLIKINVNEIFFQEILDKLWQRYQDKYTHVDLRNLPLAHLLTDEEWQKRQGNQSVSEKKIYNGDQTTKIINEIAAV